jgi:phage tail-like protein
VETRNDPYGQFKFQVKIDGIIVAGFSEVSGLTTDTNIIEYREGSDNVGTENSPGTPKYADTSLAQQPIWRNARRSDKHCSGL